MGKLKRIFVPVLMFAILVANMVFLLPTSVYADNKNSNGNSLATLVDAVAKKNNTTIGWDYSTRTYKMKDGGYYTYTELTSSTPSIAVKDAELSKLTSGAKREFLSDYYSAALRYVDYWESKGSENTNGVTSETMNSLLTILQNKAGVGSTLISSIMSQTKPDFVSANRIYAPFSGIVGTVLGLVAVLIIAFLAITMVLDIAYIAIPTFQLFVDGDGGQGGQKKSFISYEAMQAVQQAQGGGGGSGQDGGLKKVAVFIYLKSRVLMLIILGVCILYLVSGNIFSLVGLLIDLMSGFLGF